MSAEDTRNFYRNQGIVGERERIIEMIQNQIFVMQKITDGIEGHKRGSEIMPIRIKTLESAIALIKAETE